MIQIMSNYLKNGDFYCFLSTHQELALYFPRHNHIKGGWLEVTGLIVWCNKNEVKIQPIHFIQLIISIIFVFNIKSIMFVFLILKLSKYGNDLMSEF